MKTYPTYTDVLIKLAIKLMPEAFHRSQIGLQFCSAGTEFKCNKKARAKEASATDFIRPESAIGLLLSEIRREKNKIFCNLLGQ